MHRVDPNADAQWPRLSEFIAERMGLHFPRERLADLQRGLAAAAKDFGFDDPAACADWLMTAPLTRAQLQVLASHLTVGETYFFREPNTFEILANHVLPDLIRARRGCEQRLRLWSAACASGEEAYSLAILLHQALPDLAAWHVTILATDINPRFLRKAVAGAYSDWSFRGVPRGFRERYFDRTSDGRYAIRPELRRMVTFEHLNLVEDVYPSLATDTNAMDVIFCRNMLMYFAPAQIRKVVGNFGHSLIAGGWLVVAPGETSQALFQDFATVSFPGVILYRKAPVATAWPPVSPPMAVALSGPPPPVPAVPPPAVPSAPAVPESAVAHTAPTSRAAAASLYHQGRYGDAAEALQTLSAGCTPERDVLSLLVRALANQGRLVDALAWCDRWIASYKLDAVAYYLRAVVLMESGKPDEARRSLLQTLYLEADFVLAHFALGNLARTRGKGDEAYKHFGNTLRILNRVRSEDELPESEGLTAGRLKDTIIALISVGTDEEQRQPRHDHA
ncbi:MAG: CheR family methyltransferase [Vicinamibacterales bacterium]